MSCQSRLKSTRQIAFALKVIDRTKSLAMTTIEKRIS